MQPEEINSNSNSVWAVVEMFGHVTKAGRLTKPSEWGGLWQLDIPEGEEFRTEFVSTQAIYCARIVSEDIARAYAQPSRQVIAYDAPIVTRAEHLAAMESAQRINDHLRNQVNELERRLTAIKALPQPIEDTF